jgi:hypothetical protein
MVAPGSDRCNGTTKLLGAGERNGEVTTPGPAEPGESAGPGGLRGCLTASSRLPAASLPGRLGAQMGAFVAEYRRDLLGG